MRRYSVKTQVTKVEKHQIRLLAGTEREISKIQKKVKSINK